MDLCKEETDLDMTAAVQVQCASCVALHVPRSSLRVVSEDSAMPYIASRSCQQTNCSGIRGSIVYRLVSCLISWFDSTAHHVSSSLACRRCSILTSAVSGCRADLRSHRYVRGGAARAATAARPAGSDASHVSLCLVRLSFAPAYKRLVHPTASPALADWFCSRLWYVTILEDAGVSCILLWSCRQVARL